MNAYTFRIGEEEAGERIDAYLASRLDGKSRSYIQKLITGGTVMRNGRICKPSVRLTEDDVVEITLPDPVPLEAQPEEMPLSIVYEDDDLLVVDKPKGLSVHPGAGHPDHTLVNGLLYHCAGRLSGINGVERPGIVHRIDKDTSGLLVVCKNDAAHRSIAAQLAAHTIHRRYFGITCGVPSPDRGTVESMIGRDPNMRLRMAADVAGGKRAVTHYETDEILPGHALCRFRLETGRTHQIRVHMAKLHHPLLGDTLYGAPKEPFHTEGQTLHAGELGFVHPTTGEYLEFTAPLPEYFTRILKILRNLRA